MRGQYTTSRKFYPVRIQKKYLRTVREKKRYKSESHRTNSISVNLRDLGDVDAKELNTIPSSISEEISWRKRPDVGTEERSLCPNPLLQVNSGQFCTMCTAELLKIHGDESGSDTCIHMEETECEALAKARSFFEQNVMNLLNGFDKKLPEKRSLQVVTSKDCVDTLGSPKQENKKPLAPTPENRITCSMSKLSMQACLSTSDSTISAVISEAVQTPPSLFVWSSSSDERVFSTSTEEGKLKLLCGEILLQLCKATAGNVLKRETAEYSGATGISNSIGGNTVVSVATSQDQKQVDQNITAVTQQLPEWLQGLTRERSQSQTGVHQKNELPNHRNTAVKLKAPSKTFKPLLCTKLSVPWRGRKHSSHHCAVYLRPQTKNSTLLASVSSSSVIERPKSQVMQPQQMKHHNQTDDGVTDLKPKQEGTKRKNKELREHEVCPKCKSSLRSINHNNPVSVKAKPIKGRRERAHKRWSLRRHKRISKEIRTKRKHHTNMPREATPKNSETKYFIKSFFTGTSSEATPKSKSNEKTSRKLLVKPHNRRKKSTFTLPHDVTVGQAGVNPVKKKPEEDSHAQQPPGKIKSKDDVDFLMSKELKMISKHVKAHDKRVSDSTTPLFHTCFKHILSRELKNKGVHGRKPQTQQKENSHHKKTKGAGNVSGFPQKWEKRKFNDSLFSCLIPRVFK